MRKLSTMIAIAAAAVLSVSLSACSHGGDTDAEPKPTTTSSSTTAAAPKSGVCEDGQLIITKKDLKKDAYTVDAACKLVAVTVSDATITIGADVDTVSLEGEGNTIDAQRIGQLALFGSGNTIKHTGDKPALADTGAGTPDDTTYVQK